LTHSIHFLTLLGFEFRALHLPCRHSTTLATGQPFSVLAIFKGLMKDLPKSWTTILLLSASWVVRITGVSHRDPVCLSFHGTYVTIDVPILLH
jgi:hypothetical protein